MTRRPTLIAVVILCLAVVAGAGVYAGRVPILSRAGTWLDVGRRPRASDYVLILNGEENTRPFAAAAILKAGLARKAIVTTCTVYPDQEDGLAQRTHEVTLEVLTRRGVPRSSIVVLDRLVDSTFDEARALADFLRADPEARVTVVTNAFHTRRARWIFQQELGARSGRIAFVSASQEDLPLDRWWTTSLGRECIPAEYMRLVFYLFRYSKGPWLAVLAIGAATAMLLYWVAWRNRAARESLPQG